MSIVCTVRIPHDLAKVQRVEEANPEVMEPIGQAAMKYMTGHRRLAQGDEVLDLDEFPDRAAYDAFIAEAGPSIARYGELLGAPAVDTVYDVVEGG